MTSRCKITSIGEILFDFYQDKKLIGGAPFNFIYHINKISGNTNFVSGVGNDIEGHEIHKFLTKNRISTEFLKIISSKSTGKVIIKLNEKGIPNFNIEQNVAYDYISLLDTEKDKLIGSSKLFYYGTLCQRNPISRDSIHSLFNSDSLYFCDLNLRQNFYSKEIIEDSLNSCDILKLNEDELNVVAKLCFNRSFGIEKDAEKLKSKYIIQYIAITQGKKGARLFSKNIAASNRPTAIRVVDTTGAGDAYSAVLALGIMNNIDLNKINHLAVDFASDICKVKGALPQNDEIYSKFRQQLLNE